MKINKFVFGLILSVGLLISNPASAHYLWMGPIGEQDIVNSGDAVGIDVYLHAEKDDSLNFWSVEVGFDDAAVLDTAELTFVDIAYAATVLGPGPGSYAYQYNDSLKYTDPGNGASRVWDVSRASLTSRQSVTDGEDFLLFTANFTFVDGIFDGEDIWLEWEPGIDGFSFEGDYINSLDIYTDNTKATLIGNNGPDYAAVPLPGAIFLLVPAFLGMIGLRRKKA